MLLLTSMELSKIIDFWAVADETDGQDSVFMFKLIHNAVVTHPELESPSKAAGQSFVIYIFNMQA